MCIAIVGGDLEAHVAFRFEEPRNVVEVHSNPLRCCTITIILVAQEFTGAATMLTNVGVRDALFDAHHGFLLNGVKVLIKGTSNHLGFGGVGQAVPGDTQSHGGQ
eukprot:COSAG02_NODE_1650_length_11487_cov_13.602895_5_plen_105_part_00